MLTPTVTCAVKTNTAPYYLRLMNCRFQICKNIYEPVCIVAIKLCLRRTLVRFVLYAAVCKLFKYFYNILFKELSNEQQIYKTTVY